MVSHGLRTGPDTEVKLDPEAQRSSQTLLPAMVAPAASSRSTTVASRLGTKPSTARDPFIIGMPATAMLSLFATALAVAAWGYFLHQGVVDPLGGVNTLWPLFGISNQMLAALALTLATVVLCKMKRERYAWITGAPTVWLLVCTLTAGWQKLFHESPAIGFLAHARKFADAAAAEWNGQGEHIEPLQAK